MQNDKAGQKQQQQQKNCPRNEVEWADERSLAF